MTISLTFGAAQPWTKLPSSRCRRDVAPEMKFHLPPLAKLSKIKEKNREWIVDVYLFTMALEPYLDCDSSLMGGLCTVYCWMPKPDEQGSTMINLTYSLPNMLFLKCSRHNFLLWYQLPRRSTQLSWCNLESFELQSTDIWTLYIK